MTSTFVENIKKMMGWCPDSSAAYGERTITFEQMSINAPDGGRELNSATAGWWDKYRNRRLFTSIMVTLFAATLFLRGGINEIGIFLIGFLIGSSIGVLEWQRGLKAINKLAELGSIKYSRKAIVAIVITIILSPILFWYSGHIFGEDDTFAFTSGLFFMIWIKYFEIMYWEKNNMKKLFIQNHRIFVLPDTG